MEILRGSIYFAEVICLIFALITIKKQQLSSDKYIMLILILTFLIESIGFFNYHFPNIFFIKILKSNKVSLKLIEENLLIYNIAMILTYLLYMAYYNKLLNSIKKKHIIIKISIIYLIICIIDIVFNLQTMALSYLAYSRIFGALFLFICASIYLKEVFKSNIILHFHKTLPFWVTIGALMFYLTTIPIFIFGEKLNFSHEIFLITLGLSSYVLYGSMIIGFIINAYQENKKLKTDNG